MKKSKTKNIETNKSLDLHNVKHQDVNAIVESYIIRNQHDMPLKIITGNSEKMKSMVIDCLVSYKFKYKIGDPFNQGYIVVFK